VTRAISQRWRRTYFNNPLIEESLQHLPAALSHPTSVEFRAYLTAKLHHSSAITRFRYAEYIAQRFSHDGRMNLDLARALARFGDSRTGREIFYFELIEAVPILKDTASLWLAEQDEAGAPRSALLSFLGPRLEGKQVERVAQAIVTALRRCRKLAPSKPAILIPLRAEPPIEAFLYVLARMFPERTMTRVDLFAATPEVRAMLWPRAALPGLLQAAMNAGHVSKVSELDQYHQFTLADSGAARMELLLAETASNGRVSTSPIRPADRRPRREQQAEQRSLFPPPQGSLFPKGGE
jgi:hypothetical protein